ncbi:MULTISPECIES: transporter [unclassified Ruegeria]|uniref:AEC family transporter n=1 Tax=unclassified Ruegeria TaxID=2625375 RepID=UPI001AD9668C|nr:MULTISPECIES: transporter [unclassified Ruegeria]MBO9410862.1 transporter [Ruegeria sp. R8_1]MBO9415063.1 transporter [Ruegeria sp. R8_2]
MEQIFLNVLNVVLPVLICAGIGYVLAITRAPFDNTVVGGIVSRVGYPTLIISHLSTTNIAVGTFVDVMAAAALAIAGFGILGLVALRAMQLPVRAFLTPLMHGNVGNIGLPITLLALGDAGMAYTMAFVVVVLISVFTVGMWIPAGAFSAKKLVTSPIIYAVAISLGLMATGYSLPAPVAKSFDILGGLSIPLMLLTLGHTLAGLRVQSLGRSVLLTMLHLGMAVLIASVLVWTNGFTGAERGAVILCCLMPSSVATYLFIDQHMPEYGPDVAGFILVSTLATILVLPLALSYWI